MKSYCGKQAIERMLPDLLSDESRFTSGIPAKVFFPQGQSDVQEVVAEASGAGVPLTIIGAQTGITGGAVPTEDCIAVSFAEMKAIRRIERQGTGAPVLYCQPGATLADIGRFLESPADWPYCVEGAEHLEPNAWFLPPDPTETTAQIGGAVATNASGSRSYRFGPMRDFVESLSVVLVGGDTLCIVRGGCVERNGQFIFATDRRRTLALARPSYESPRLKNAAGYYSRPGMDLIDLFIGSEGTLGIFFEIGVRLLPAAKFVSGLSFFPSRQDCFTFADFLRGRAEVAAIEYFDESALAFLRRYADLASQKIPEFPPGRHNAVYWEYFEAPASPFEEALEAWENRLLPLGSSFEHTWSGLTDKESALLRRLRHAVPEAVNAAVAARHRLDDVVRKVSTDAALPGAAFRGFVDGSLAMVNAAGLEYALFGHLGDFHLHLNMVPRGTAQFKAAMELYEKMMDMTIAAGGTVSAEHGVGKIKTRYLSGMYGDFAIKEMMRVKSALDPQWLLNRGNLFESVPGEPRDMER